MTEINATFITAKKFVPRKINPENMTNFTLSTPPRRNYSNDSRNSGSRNSSEGFKTSGYKSARNSVSTTTRIGKVFGAKDWRRKSTTEVRDQPYTKMILMNLPNELRSLCGVSLLFRAFEKVLGIKMLTSTDFLNLPHETKDLLGKHFTLAEYGAVVEFETARAAKTCCGLLRRQVAEQGFRACLIKPGAEQELDRQLTTLIAAKTKEIQDQRQIITPISQLPDSQTRVSTVFHNINNGGTIEYTRKELISHDSGHDIECGMRKLSLFSKGEDSLRVGKSTEDSRISSSDCEHLKSVDDAPVEGTSIEV